MYRPSRACAIGSPVWRRHGRSGGFGLLCFGNANIKVRYCESVYEAYLLNQIEGHVDPHFFISSLLPQFKFRESAARSAPHVTDRRVLETVVERCERRPRKGADNVRVRPQILQRSHRPESCPTSSRVGTSGRSNQAAAVVRTPASPPHRSIDLTRSGRPSSGASFKITGYPVLERESRNTCS